MKHKRPAILGAVFGLALIIILGSSPALATIPGLPGPTFDLTAKDGYISAPDGGQIYTWGYGVQGGMMQYPGPTLIVNQGDVVTIKLINELPTRAGNVSMVFPGHEVQPSGGVAGALTQEAPPGGTPGGPGEVTYTFTASNPGTYLYFSGSWSDLHIDMGLTGALIVRSGTAGQAYNHPDSAYDYEYLFFLSEMDIEIHWLVEAGLMDQVDTSTFNPTFWFINGRSAPDTMLMPGAGAPWLPHQPYNCMPQMIPGSRLLLRVVGGGRDLHPFHHHGNNSLVIAEDGRLRTAVDGADLAWSDFTLKSVPGSTMDSIFEWTGEKLGWDMYGHLIDLDNAPTGNFPGAEDVDHNGDGILDEPALEPNEYAPDHGKPLPTVLPHKSELTYGGLYSGSPFMGAESSLPPGEGGMNPNSGFAFMWHSHNEKEMITNDVFPGGMMTNLIIQPPGTPID